MPLIAADRVALWKRVSSTLERAPLLPAVVATACGSKTMSRSRRSRREPRLRDVSVARFTQRSRFPALFVFACWYWPLSEVTGPF